MQKCLQKFFWLDRCVIDTKMSHAKKNLDIDE